MKSITKVLLLSFLLLAAGFYAANEAVPIIDEPTEENEENSVVEEVVNENRSLLKYVDEETIVASWYGPNFHGNLTANGEIYDQMALTAAHKTLPFGTLLRVTNLSNGKSVIVRINDRGPYIPGRSLDLSKGSAEAIDLIPKGVGKVKIEHVVLASNDFPIVSVN